MFGESRIYHRKAWELTAGYLLFCKAAAWPKDTVKLWPGYCHQISNLWYLKFIDFTLLGFWFFFLKVLSTSLKPETPHKKGLNHKKQDRFNRKALVMIITYFHINYYIWYYNIYIKCYIFKIGNIFCLANGVRGHNHLQLLEGCICAHEKEKFRVVWVPWLGNQDDLACIRNRSIGINWERKWWFQDLLD